MRARCTSCSCNKWYFDELIDALVVRPTAAAGRFARDTFERVFVDETLVGGTTGIVRAGSAAVRAAQSGFVRYYAALLCSASPASASTSCCSPERELIEHATALDPDLAAGRVRPARRARLGAVPQQAAWPARRPRTRTATPTTGAPGPAACRARWRCSARSPRSGSRSPTSSTTRAGGAALQHVTDVVWISELGIHYKLAISGLNVFLVGLTTLLFAAAMLAANLRSWERPRALLLPLHARRVGGARRVPRPGPRAVRRLLRPDADPVLLPDRRMGPRPGPGRVKATIKLVIYTLVGSLLMLAAAIATGVLAAAAGRRAHHVRALGAAGAAAEQRLAGVDLPVLRRRVPRQDAGLPAARLDARRLPGDADRGADGLLRRALEGRRLRLSGDRAAAVPARRGALPDADAADRAAVDHLRLAAGVQPDRRAPDRRVLLGRAARLHHARDLRAEPAGRAGRAAADGQPRARRRAAAVHRRRCSRGARAARRTSATWAASRSARRCSRRSS